MNNEFLEQEHEVDDLEFIEDVLHKLNWQGRKARRLADELYSSKLLEDGRLSVRQGVHEIFVGQVWEVKGRVHDLYDDIHGKRR